MSQIYPKFLEVNETKIYERTIEIDDDAKCFFPTMNILVSLMHEIAHKSDEQIHRFIIFMDDSCEIGKVNMTIKWNTILEAYG